MKTIDSLSLREKIEFPVVREYQSLLGEKIVAMVADKNHAGYPAETITFITEKAVTFKAYDAAQPNSANVEWKIYGDNSFGRSCVNQWLNSSAGDGQWFRPYSAEDQAPTEQYVTANPYDNWPGLLAMLDPRVVARMVLTDYPTFEPVPGEGLKNLRQKICLPSQTEMAQPDSSGTAEGAAFPIFTDNASRQTTAAEGSGASDTTSPVQYWTRSKSQGAADSAAQMIGTSGQKGQNRVNNGQHGIRFIFNLPKNAAITDNKNSAGNYEFVYTQAPTTPGIPVSGNPIAGKPWVNTWAPSTEPDGEEITYIVESKTDTVGWKEEARTTGTSYTLQIPDALRPGDSVPITWIAGEGAEKYAIQRQINGGAWEDLATTAATNYTDTAPSSAERHTTVQYRVASMRQGEKTEYVVSNAVHIYVSGVNGNG